MTVMEKRVRINDVFDRLKTRRNSLESLQKEMKPGELTDILATEAEIRAIDSVREYLLASKEKDTNKALNRAVKFAVKNAKKYGQEKMWKTPCDLYMSRGYTNAHLTILPLTYR